MKLLIGSFGRLATHEFSLVFRVSRLAWHELPTVCAEGRRKGCFQEK